MNPVLILTTLVSLLTPIQGQISQLPTAAFAELSEEYVNTIREAEMSLRDQAILKNGSDVLGRDELKWLRDLVLQLRGMQY